MNKKEKAVYNFLKQIIPESILKQMDTKETLRRVVKAWDDMLQGYKENPQVILSKKFKMDDTSSVPYVSTDMVLVKDIGFHSLCEHHLLPFFGKAAVGYFPKDRKVVGISKLVRLVDCFSKRLQIQERMTKQIAESLSEHSIGVGVHVEGIHMCMCMRGVRRESPTTTMSFNGIMQEPDKKNLFLQNIRR
ncbi:MAG: GTP cyclohydrolase I [Thaumarchaeota archaeon]|nr:GTP cyclohydrolase I [Nitrososphaerota archaeon]